jgi:hypothetical protein
MSNGECMRFRGEAKQAVSLLDKFFEGQLKNIG